MPSLRLYSIVLAAAVASAVGVTVWMRRHRKTEAERERERRAWLSTTGRIIDGTVTDVQEIVSDGVAPIQLLFYRYEIAGVIYEASQDITYLRQFVDVHSCRLGLHASIKYDPHHPGNSIVVSEGWTGLR